MRPLVSDSTVKKQQLGLSHRLQVLLGARLLTDHVGLTGATRVPIGPTLPLSPAALGMSS